MEHSSELKTMETFANFLGESLAESLARKLGVPWVLKSIDEPDATNQLEKAVHFRLSASGELQGDCYVAFNQEQVASLGSKFLGEPDSALDPQAEALAEVIVSGMGGLSSALFTRFGAVTFKVDRVEDVRLEDMLVLVLAASGGEEADVPVRLYFSEQMVASLAPSDAERPSMPKTDAANLQLVMDVELNVSLRFGQCQLPLRDVLDLTSGSVIELDRDVDDPVELLLDGKVIARGEAVIVDGNYGLRITEIPEPIASHFVR